MNRWLVARIPCLTLLSAAIAAAGEPAFVTESARGIPVSHRVDVVVVGGTTGAVAAATAAAREGARVFLAAPMPYLGDDMTATLRLWLEEGERPTSPLAKRIFAERRRTASIADPERLLSFRYEADRPSAGVHRDTAPPSRLADGRWGEAVRESVQYDGDVAITADLGAPRRLERAFAMVYHRGDFRVARVRIATSLDGKRWTDAADVPNDAPPQATVGEPARVLSAPLSGEARYVRFTFERAPGARRILLGEIALVKAGGPDRPARRETIPPARPLHVKKVLDEALIEADVAYLYSTYATDVLRDADGNPCGIIMANRAGRQAVVARVIIDATERAWVARMAGARFRPFPAGLQKLGRVVVGGAPRPSKASRVRTIAPPFRRAGRVYDIIEYTLQVPMPDGSFASRARAEQLARDATYDPDQQFTADLLFQVPPDPMVGQAHGSGPWRGVEALDIGAFRPAGIPRLYVLGGCADLPRDQAEALLRPLALIDMGTRIGIAAARDARGVPASRGIRVPGRKAPPAAPGDVREALAGVRPIQERPSIPQEERSIPVLGIYDVVVIGGGTSGAPAGIGAARRGARTLVVEYLHGLGGVGTQGAISKYYWGNRVGFSAEVLGGRPGWAIERKMEWWRRALRDAGADIWFGAMGCGAFVDRGRVRGAVVATPAGRGVILAGAVIDATGNADIAAAAGASCRTTDATDIAVQGTGLPPRRLGASYTNTDFTIVDETDMLDVWHVFVYAKYKAGDAFDMGRLIDTRERRRIVGDATVTILDEMNGRTYPDTVVVARSDFDTHGYTTDPYFTLRHPPHGKGFLTRIPYRALLPKGLDGILVAGLGMSAHRDALPLIRMQADIQNQGYAAGVAAAMAAKAGVGTRGIDVRALQRHLLEIGNLPESVLKEEDSYPMPEARIRAAVAAVRDGYRDAAVILAHPRRALPLLREAYAAADSAEDRLAYAHILAVLGDHTGVEDLIAAVEATPGLDEGWRYTGMGQYGPNMSRLDRLIYALGMTRDRRATPAILAKLERLEPGSAFSHFRAMALALERIGDPAAARPVAELLARPGIQGHASTTIEDAIERAKRWPSWTATEPRSLAIRELLLARALFRCGDWKGLGRRILEAYTKDLRGHLARHAHAVLRSPEP